MEYNIEDHLNIKKLYKKLIKQELQPLNIVKAHPFISNVYIEKMNLNDFFYKTKHLKNKKLEIFINKRYDALDKIHDEKKQYINSLFTV